MNRNKLLHKLCNDFNVSGRLLLYLHKFLSDRQTRLKVNDLIGEWLSSDNGTLAGTILETLLFIAYVHDTPLSIYPKFADDFAAMASGSDAAAVEVILQDTLDKLQIWTKKWNMDLNISKTKVMLFANNNPGQVTIGIDGVTIEQVDEFKYLGVMLDGKQMIRAKYDSHT